MNRQQRRAAEKADKPSKRSPAALFEAGLRYLQSRQFADAEKCCLEILAVDPDHAGSLHLLGLIAAGTKSYAAATEFIAQAIRKNPNNPDYFLNLGTMLQQQDRLQEALKSFDLALSLKPDFVEAWNRLGHVLQRQNRFEEAVLAYDRALKINPRQADAANHADALNGLGSMLFEAGKADEALPHLRRAIGVKPDHVAALNNLSIVLVHLKQFEEALTTIDRALSIGPGLAELFNNKGNALKALGRLDDAITSYDRAIALKPDYVQAHSNRGNCLDDLARYGEALSSYRDALALQPDYAEAHWNVAVNSLRTGNFSTGWIESEWRWKCRSLRLRDRQFEQQLWTGAEPIDGKVLLLHNEQGLGDALQFCRYIPLAAARGARVVLEIDAPLQQLLGGMAGVSHCVSKGEPLPDFDFHCSLNSLPLAFDTTLDTIPSAMPYISAGTPSVDWEARLGPKHLPRIGLVWAGNPNHGNDHNRSIPLQTLLPLLDAEAQFVSLQKNVHAREEALLREKSDILHLGPELQNFTDTAALAKQLDLVISVDTSVAHLAGALGLPVWVLLPYVPDWRWLLERDDSPWYPTARLFRQSQTRDWSSVVNEARRALDTFMPQLRIVKSPR